VAALLCAPVTADAVVRYADPGSADTTGDCTVLPCRLDRAISVAAAYDSVQLAGGTYNVSYPVAATNLIDVYGAPGEQTSRVIGTGASATIAMTWGGTLSNVYVSASASGQYALDLKAVNADRVVAEATGGAHAINLVSAAAPGTWLRNSVANVTSGTGTAVNISGTGVNRSTTLLNVTALSPGGTAIAAGGSAPITIRNTIARGSVDISGSPAISYSNYRTAKATGVTPGAGDQTASDPIFVIEAAGDLRPGDGSPTIDAGAADAAIGTADVAGATRTVGAAIDIGANERQVAPPPPPPPPPPPLDPDPGAPDTSTATGTDPGTEPDPGTDAGIPPLPDAAPPVLGTSVGLGEVKGSPLVQLPGTTTFIPLTQASTVPVGSIVDATKGTVDLTTVRDSSGRTQTGTFWGGAFVVQQARDGMTELALTGGDFSPCTAKPTRRGKVDAARTSRHSSRVRRLWGRDRGGRFSTRGRHGTATVRGTRWLTEDRCDGTFFKVTEGAIDVRDDRKRRTVRLKRGGSYLAGAVAAKKKRRR
jgi:hypothetical protein